MSIRDGERNHSVTIGTGIQAGSAGQFQVQHNFTFSKSPILREEDIRCALDPLGCPRQPLSRLQINNSGTFVDWTPNNPLFGKLQFNIGGGYTREPLRGTSPEYHASFS